MARDSAGNHTLPAGNPVVSDTGIASSWANQTMSDISQAVTDSLDRNGRGGMLAPLKGFAGTKASPGLSFSSETGSGFYYAGTGDVRFALRGVDLLQFKSGKVNWWDGSAWQMFQAATNDLSTDTITGATDTGVSVSDVILDEDTVLADEISAKTVAKVDSIIEYTTDAGVTVEGVLVKDGGITADGTIDFTGATVTSLGSATVAEIDELTVDELVEKNTDSGITVDGLLIKDGGIPEAAVTAHEAALEITEAQISDLQTYALAADVTTSLEDYLPRTSDIRVVTGTSLTLAASDLGKDIVFTSASAVTVTIDGALDPGFQCTLTQVGAGTVTITSSDNLNGASADIDIPAQWATVWPFQYSEGNWLIGGVS